MNPHENNADAIDRFLRGKMSPPEEIDFKQKMKEDPDLAAEVEEATILMESILYAQEKDRLLAKIRQVEMDLESEGFFAGLPSVSKEKKSFWQRSVGVNTMAFAAVLGLVLVAVYFFRPTSGIHDVAFHRFFKPAPHELLLVLDRLDGVGFVSSDKSREYALLQALRPFAAGHYQQAGQALDTFLMAYPNDPIASQYRAITLLEQGDAIGAAQLLSPLSQDRSFPYQETAQWYLALSYLHLNDPAHTLQACALLRDLAAKPSGDYQQEAIQLLQQLS